MAFNKILLKIFATIRTLVKTAKHLIQCRTLIFEKNKITNIYSFFCFFLHEFVQLNISILNERQLILNISLTHQRTFFSFLSTAMLLKLL